MNVQEYLASGILQDYCLGFLSNEEMQEIESHAKLHPEIQDEISANKRALENYANQLAQQPSDSVKAKLFQSIDVLIEEQNASLNNLPLLNKNSDYKNWLKIVAPLIVTHQEKEFSFQVLRDDETVLQMLVWTKVDYPDEVHDHLKESFIILQGECECYVGENTYKLGPGGYLDIPLFQHHDIKVVKGPVLAIVQRLKVA